ncbi:MAG: phage tail protein [Deltaproteobacteria bacterium]|nr:phage tail protein [Deltaproteobacteria bacterium]
MNRRLLSGLAILCGLVLLAPGTGSGATKAQDRSSVAGNFVLLLDGQVCGVLRSATGGGATADVINEARGSDWTTRKHLGSPKYEEITIQVGMDACSGLYGWIAAALNNQSSRKNGAVVTVDYDYKEISRVEFFNALISEIGFPAMDGSAKEPVYLTVKLSPEQTRRMKGGGAKVNVGTSQQKRWLPSNFRFQIAGLDAATTRVNRIEAFTVKVKITEGGGGRDAQKQPAGLEIPNLSFTLPESYADAVYAWHEDFVIKGNNSDGKERSGTLEWLSPDQRATYGKLNLRNIGIIRVSSEPGTGESAKRVRVDVYVETVGF